MGNIDGDVIPKKILEILEMALPRDVPMTQEEKDLLRLHLKEKGIVADKVTKKTQRKANAYEKQQNLIKRKEVGKIMKENKEKEVKAVDVEKAGFVKAVVEAMENIACAVAVDKATVFIRGQEADFEVKVVMKKDRLAVFDDAEGETAE